MTGDELESLLVRYGAAERAVPVRPAGRMWPTAACVPLSKIVAGGLTPAEAEHVAGCGYCGAAAAKVRGGLATDPAVLAEPAPPRAVRADPPLEWASVLLRGAGPVAPTQPAGHFDLKLTDPADPGRHRLELTADQAARYYAGGAVKFARITLTVTPAAGGFVVAAAVAPPPTRSAMTLVVEFPDGSVRALEVPVGAAASAPAEVVPAAALAVTADGWQGSVELD